MYGDSRRDGFEFLNFEENSTFDLSEKDGKMTYQVDDQSLRRCLTT